MSLKARRGLKCLSCRHMQTNHSTAVDSGGVPYWKCPPGDHKNAGLPSRGFEQFVTNIGRSSTSFGQDEVEFLNAWARATMSGRDLGGIRRSPTFPKVAKKIFDMKARLEEKMERAKGDMDVS